MVPLNFIGHDVFYLNALKNIDETSVYIDKPSTYTYSKKSIFNFIFKFKYLNHWNFYKNRDPEEFQLKQAVTRELEFQRLLVRRFWYKIPHSYSC